MECTRCGRTHLVKNGSVHGVPKWLCRGCGYQSCRRGQPGKPESLKLQAVVLYLHGLSRNAVAKLFGVSAPAVLKWSKSYAHRHGSKPEPITGGVVVMELDEMWHYLKKCCKLWISKAYCRDTGQLVDWEWGDRDQATCNRLLERLKRWTVRLFCTDEYTTYGTAIPIGRLYTGKEETWRLEQNNGRQRHWLARFRRKSIVVSKSKEMVDLSIALFAAFHVNKTWQPNPSLVS